jgi:ISXO2-like transposase domain
MRPMGNWFLSRIDTVRDLSRFQIHNIKADMIPETDIGDAVTGVRGRKTVNKSLIVIAAQEDGAGIGRIRMRRIPDASAESLMLFIEEAVEPGSLVHTDGWIGYLPLEEKGLI